MKKFLSFILILTMVLSVSSFAMAETCTEPCTHGAAIGDEHYATLEDALAVATGTEPVTITLLKDASINVSDAYIKLGGASTPSITIDGQGAYDLLLTTTYWSRLDMANSNGKLILKNIPEMTSSQTSGTWNSYDVTFRCAVEVENVGFKKAVAVEKNAKLTNVTIEETHDYYALWIEANGQTVELNNVTINSAGRGIKIDEQYNDSPKKVSLIVNGGSVESAKKAAIMVKSKAGAEVIIDNLDISKVAADSVAAVWVDEDAAATVNDVITNASKKVEGKYVVIPPYGKVEGDTVSTPVARIGNTYYYTLQEAINAAEASMNGTVTIQLLADNAETVTVSQKEGLNLVIDGKKSDTENYKMTGTINIHGNSRHTGEETLTIRNIAFEKDSGDAIWSDDGGDGVKRYAHNVTIKDCTFTGDAIVGTRIRQGYNISIIDCVMNSGHSLMQNTNNTGVTVKGTEVNATEGGLNLFASTGVLVEDCDITANDYGVRVDANANGDATITNTKIDAEQPVIVRNVTGGYKLTANTGNVFTVGEGKSPVNIAEGAGTVTYTDNFAAMNGTTNTYYNSMDEAIADAKPGETVYPVEKGDVIEDGAVTIPEPTAPAKPRDSIKVKYEGGNSFSTSKSAVPTSVEIDGVPVPFTGNGKLFTVGCIDPDAEWVTVRWNSTSVTVNFKPDVTVSCPVMSIPKTGDMPLWMAVAEFFGF